MSNIYYDGTDLLNRALFLNFIKGERGNGKTFYFKRRAIKRFITKKRQFIWLRRYKTEIDNAFRKSFLDDIIEASYNPDVVMSDSERKMWQTLKWKLSGNIITINDERAGYYYALSTTSGKKSTPYPKVDELIFDEYLLKPKTPYHYIPEEVTTFLEFVSTVCRLRDNFKAFCIGNNMSWSDPYSLYFGMKPTKQRFTKYRNPYNNIANVLMEITNCEAYRKRMYSTQFGQLVEGTQYGKYAIDNDSLTDNLDFIKPKSRNSYFRFAIRYNGMYIGFWLDQNEGRMYASRKYDKTSKRLYSLTREDHTLNTYLIVNRRNLFYLRELLLMFANGELYFEDFQVKNNCLEMLQYLI